MGMTDSVSIVVNCKDRQEDIDRLFKSFELYGFNNCEVLLLDDGSTIPLRAPSYVSVFRNEKPSGVGAGRNFLISKATREYVLVCDDDIEITRPDLLDKPLEFCRKYENKVMVAASQSDARGALRTFQPSSANSPSFVHRFFGYCFFVPRSEWLKVGGLCEVLFYQFEEIEFSWRWIDAGFKIIHDPNFVVIHYFRAESSRQVQKKHRNILRNMLISSALRMPYLVLPFSILQSTVIYWGIARNFGWKTRVEVPAAYFQFLKMLPGIISKRRPLKYKTIQYLRKTKRHPVPIMS